MKKDRQYDFGQLKQWIKDHAREEKDFTEFLELIDLFYANMRKLGVLDEVVNYDSTVGEIQDDKGEKAPAFFVILDVQGPHPIIIAFEFNDKMQLFDPQFLENYTTIEVAQKKSVN